MKKPGLDMQFANSYRILILIETKLLVLLCVNIFDVGTRKHFYYL